MKINFSKKTLISFVIIYLLAVGSTYSVLATLSPSTDLLSPANEATVTTTSSGITISSTDPKTEVCPLNGQKYTLTERQAWEKFRPANVMIENHFEARPQSGLSSADIVYEAVAEGGITRFMGVFYCGAQANLGKVAPVRSARMHFVNLAAEYNTPVYVHVGGANCSAYQTGGPCTTNKKAQAIEELAKLGWRQAKGNDFDTTFDVGVPVLGRDYNRLGTSVQLATEHTMVGDLGAIWKEATKRGFTGKMADGSIWLSGFRSWKFKDVADATAGTGARKISFEFWKGYKDFAITWDFDATTGLYKRTMGGTPHIDLENKQQLSARTVIIEFTKEEGPLDEHKHMLDVVIGNGKALIFTNGTVIDATWKKTNQTSRTIYTDATGKEYTFNPGQIWIEVVANGDKIDYN